MEVHTTHVEHRAHIATRRSPTIYELASSPPPSSSPAPLTPVNDICDATTMELSHVDSHLSRLAYQEHGDAGADAIAYLDEDSDSLGECGILDDRARQASFNRKLHDMLLVAQRERSSPSSSAAALAPTHGSPGESYSHLIARGTSSASHSESALSSTPGYLVVSPADDLHLLSLPLSLSPLCAPGRGLALDDCGAALVSNSASNSPASRQSSSALPCTLPARTSSSGPTQAPSVTLSCRPSIVSIKRPGSSIVNKEKKRRRLSDPKRHTFGYNRTRTRSEQRPVVSRLTGAFGLRYAKGPGSLRRAESLRSDAAEIDVEVCVLLHGSIHALSLLEGLPYPPTLAICVQAFKQDADPRACIDSVRRVRPHGADHSYERKHRGPQGRPREPAQRRASPV
ncbi:hypothetical protein OH77DRAFT_1304560 [Trametes cingulata]|nr:hypothetical protein OH77DRAFT_1304560 [Trametes cingulata]